MKKFVIVMLFNIAFGALAGGLTAVYLLRHRFSTITVGRVVVTDELGVERAVLGVNSTKQASLDFFGYGKDRLLSVGIVKNPFQRNGLIYDYSSGRQLWSPLIELDSAGGRTSAIISTEEHGNSIFSFYGYDKPYRLAIGYIGNGSDTNDPSGAWGLRAQRGFDDTSIGVLDYTTANGAKYLFPNSNEIHSNNSQKKKP